MGINPLNKYASASQDRYMAAIRNAESEKKAKEAKAKAEAERAERRKQAQAKPEQKAVKMTTTEYMADMFNKLRFAEGTTRDALLKEARSRLQIRDYWKLMQAVNSGATHRAEFY